MYLTIFFTSICLAFTSFFFREIKYTKINLFLEITLFFVVLISAGFRYGVGGDFWAYEEQYSSAVIEEFFYPSSIGYGWKLYLLIHKYVFNSFYFFIFFNSLISISLYWTLFRKLSDNKNISRFIFAVWAVVGFYSAEFHYIRAGLASALILYAFCLWEKSRFKSYILSALSFSIHYTALIAVFYYFAIRWGLKSRWKLIAVVILLWIISNLAANVLAPEVYLQGDYADSKKLNLKFIFGVLIFALLVLRRKSIVISYGENIYILVLLAVLTPILFFSFTEIGSRMRMFFSPLDGLLISILLERIGSKFLAALVGITVLFLFSIFFWANELTQLWYLPYKTWISQ
jgi:hypothetical protein